jgi:ABC-type ATPase involved in cell division
VVATHDKTLIENATGRVLQIRQGRLDTPPEI